METTCVDYEVRLGPLYAPEPDVYHWENWSKNKVWRRRLAAELGCRIVFDQYKKQCGKKVLTVYGKDGHLNLALMRAMQIIRPDLHPNCFLDAIPPPLFSSLSLMPTYLQPQQAVVVTVDDEIPRDKMLAKHLWANDTKWGRSPKATPDDNIPFRKMPAKRPWTDDTQRERTRKVSRSITRICASTRTPKALLEDKIQFRKMTANRSWIADTQRERARRSRSITSTLATTRTSRIGAPPPLKINCFTGGYLTLQLDNIKSNTAANCVEEDVLRAATEKAMRRRTKHEHITIDAAYSCIEKNMIPTINLNSENTGEKTCT